jgi:hypothetical protein
VLTRLLAAERWRPGGDPVWWRPDGRGPEFAVLDPEQAAGLDASLKAGPRRPAIPRSRDPTAGD